MSQEINILELLQKKALGLAEAAETISNYGYGTKLSQAEVVEATLELRYKMFEGLISSLDLHDQRSRSTFVALLLHRRQAVSRDHHGYVLGNGTIAPVWTALSVWDDIPLWENIIPMCLREHINSVGSSRNSIVRLIELRWRAEDLWPNEITAYNASGLLPDHHPCSTRETRTER